MTPQELIESFAELTDKQLQDNPHNTTFVLIVGQVGSDKLTIRRNVTPARGAAYMAACIVGDCDIIAQREEQAVHNEKLLQASQEAGTATKQ